MLINWFLRLLIPHWDSLIDNPLTGKPSSKSMFEVLGFYVAIALTICITAARIADHKDPDWTVILPLTLQGLGLAFAKIYQSQKNRETATPEGQPLAAPLPPGEVPPIMPQVENPNAPDGPSAV